MRRRAARRGGGRRCRLRCGRGEHRMRPGRRARTLRRYDAGLAGRGGRHRALRRAGPGRNRRVGRGTERSRRGTMRVRGGMARLRCGIPRSDRRTARRGIVLAGIALTSEPLRLRRARAQRAARVVARRCDHARRLVRDTYARARRVRAARAAATRRRAHAVIARWRDAGKRRRLAVRAPARERNVRMAVGADRVSRQILEEALGEISGAEVRRRFRYVVAGPHDGRPKVQGEDHARRGRQAADSLAPGRPEMGVAARFVT